MKWRMGLIVFALLAAACGGGGSAETDSGGSGSDGDSATDATEPLPEGAYETVRAMQLDVEASFYLCSSPMKTYDPPTVANATAQADCSSEVSLHIFNPGDVQASAASLQGSVTLIVGVNWIITCAEDAATCEKIQASTGGELIPAA